jgi:hypothetical protein
MILDLEWYCEYSNILSPICEENDAGKNLIADMIATASLKSSSPASEGLHLAQTLGRTKSHWGRRYIGPPFLQLK